ncbi:MAG: response regulator [Balneolia bacterium]|nr:response regulator [Balneolia bacterium]
MRVLFPSTLPNIAQAPDVSAASYSPIQLWEVFLEPSSYGPPSTLGENYMIHPASRLGSLSDVSEFGRKLKTQRKLKVLHIEDTPEIRLIANIFLKDEYDIQSASCGEEAVEKASKEKYDIILMDINLGEGCDGFEVSEQLRQLPGYENVAIIAVTTSNYLEVRGRCIETGFNAFIQKPFEKRDLKNTITQLMRYSR